MASVSTSTTKDSVSSLVGFRLLQASPEQMTGKCDGLSSPVVVDSSTPVQQLMSPKFIISGGKVLVQRENGIEELSGGGMSNVSGAAKLKQMATLPVAHIGLFHATGPNGVSSIDFTGNKRCQSTQHCVVDVTGSTSSSNSSNNSNSKASTTTQAINSPIVTTVAQPTSQRLVQVTGQQKTVVQSIGWPILRSLQAEADASAHQSRHVMTVKKDTTCTDSVSNKVIGNSTVSTNGGIVRAMAALSAVPTQQQSTFRATQVVLNGIIKQVYKDPHSSDSVVEICGECANCPEKDCQEFNKHTCKCHRIFRCKSNNYIPTTTTTSATTERSSMVATTSETAIKTAQILKEYKTPEIEDNLMQPQKFNIELNKPDYISDFSTGGLEKLVTVKPSGNSSKRPRDFRPKKSWKPTEDNNTDLLSITCVRPKKFQSEPCFTESSKSKIKSSVANAKAVDTQCNKVLSRKNKLLLSRHKNWLQKEIIKKRLELEMELQLQIDIDVMELILVPPEQKKDEQVVQQKKAQRKDKGKSRYTAYMLWARNVRPLIIQADSTMDFSAVNKKLGELWSLVPPNKKYNWKRKAKRLMQKSKKVGMDPSFMISTKNSVTKQNKLMVKSIQKGSVISTGKSATKQINVETQELSKITTASTVSILSKEEIDDPLKVGIEKLVTVKPSGNSSKRLRDFRPKNTDLPEPCFTKSSKSKMKSSVSKAKAVDTQCNKALSLKNKLLLSRHKNWLQKEIFKKRLELEIELQLQIDIDVMKIILVPSEQKKNEQVVQQKKAQRKDKGKSRYTGNTAYMLWERNVRPLIIQADSTMDFSAVNKKLDELWSLVPPNKKYNWKHKAKRLMQKSKKMGMDPSFMISTKNSVTKKNNLMVKNTQKGSMISTGKSATKQINDETQEWSNVTSASTVSILSKEEIDDPLRVGIETQELNSVIHPYVSAIRESAVIIPSTIFTSSTFRIKHERRNFKEEPVDIVKKEIDDPLGVSVEAQELNSVILPYVSATTESAISIPSVIFTSSVPRVKKEEGNLKEEPIDIVEEDIDDPLAVSVETQELNCVMLPYVLSATTESAVNVPSPIFTSSALRVKQEKSNLKEEPIDIVEKEIDDPLAVSVETQKLKRVILPYVSGAKESAVL